MAETSDATDDFGGGAVAEFADAGLPRRRPRRSMTTARRRRRWPVFFVAVAPWSRRNGGMCLRALKGTFDEPPLRRQVRIPGFPGAQRDAGGWFRAPIVVQDGGNAINLPSRNSGWPSRVCPN